MELNFKMYGNPMLDELIILHGMFGTLDNWQTVARELSENFCVYAIDLRNHGRSPHSEAFSYPIMAQDIADFIEEKALNRPHIIGHSMGGKVAMYLALQYPELIDGLCVVDIAPKAYAGHHEQVFKAMFAIEVETLQSRAQAETILDQQGLDYATKQFILKNLSISKETQRYEWRVNLPVIYQHYQHILSNPNSELPERQFNRACLFIQGQNSNYIDPAEWDSYTKQFPKAQLQSIAGAGHWVHADKPLEFTNMVGEWLAS